MPRKKNPATTQTKTTTKADSLGNGKPRQGSSPSGLPFFTVRAASEAPHTSAYATRPCGSVRVVFAQTLDGKHGRALPREHLSRRATIGRGRRRRSHSHAWLEDIKGCAMHPPSILYAPLLHGDPRIAYFAELCMKAPGEKTRERLHTPLSLLPFSVPAFNT